MWSSKMAARWRGADGPLNAGNSDFLASNTPIKLVLSRRAVDGVEMDTQSISSMDHSILAIFEDSSIASEDKSGVEEESETLLSALTEMLDSVEDDDGTPFDTLPDTKLLSLPENRSTVEPSLADRLRPRSKSLNMTHRIKAAGEKEEDQLLKQQSQSSLLLHSKSKKAEVEVEVFTSTSLVNLVKLMHPYCLKLHVEEEGSKLRKKSPALLSQGEVWKYERPSDESDEEINVVSDDEVTMKDTKGGDEKRNDDRLLKSVLLNGNTSRTPPSREKKRVSFGPVQVASFESAEKRLDERNLSGRTSDAGSVPLNSTKAPEDPARSALEPQTVSSELSSNQVLPLKGETKVKALSLQQYRQLRQKRQPLVEKQGNYTTKWPCVSEPPKELTPILCLQGQRPKAAPHCPDSRRSSADQLHRSLTPGHRTLHTSTLPGLHLSEAHPGTPLRRGGLKRLRTESGISPASLHPANPNVTAPESKKSPVKKPALLTTDPPNPVLLPLSVSQTASSPTTDHSSAESKAVFPSRDSSSTRHFPQIPNQPSGTSLQRQPSSSGSKPEVVLVNQGSTTLIEEIQSKFTVTASGVCSRPPALYSTTHKTSTERCSPNLVREEARLEPDTPPPLSPDKVKHPSLEPHLSRPPAPVAAPIPVKEVQPSISTSEEPAADSGIEAPDLTSLLEQFEETQAKEERVCEPEPIFATLPSNLQKGGHFDRTKPAGTQRASEEALQPLSTSESPADSETLRNSLRPQMSGGSDIPEPLGTEVVLSTQQDLPARRRNPPSKAIQLIDPRPLPSKRTHTNVPELPTTPASPHVCSSVSSDHDYCGTIDRSLTGAAQRSRASELRDVGQTSDKPQVTALDLPPAAECRKQTSACEANLTISAVDKSATQHLSEQPQTRLETGTLKEVASDGGAIDRDCVRAAPCALPTPPPSPPARARDKRRHQRRSPRSDSSSCSPSSSSSSSASPSPKRKKPRHKRSESSSSSSSSPSRSVSRSPPRRYRWSYSRSRRSRSRSRSWSQSRSPSRSPSPRVCRRQWRNVYRNRESRKLRREHEIRIQKLKAIDERRVVYVGRIRKSMTHDELRERFSQFGEVECVSLHFRDRGDHYGFVTFYNMDDAFAAIDNGGKLRRPDELPFDICFGGRRQFCNSHYADLDANREAEPTPAKSRFEDLDFDSLLKQAQRGIKR